MIVFTGDTHGTYNILNFRLPELLNVIKEENLKNLHLIISGDVGIYFFVDNNEEKNIDLLQNQLKENNIFLYFVEGNHDNIPYLQSLEKNKDGMGIVRDNIFYLNRSNIYNIDNTNILCYGGALSIDQSNRTLDIDYWREEIPNYVEFEQVMNLISSYNDIDIVLSHQGPSSIVDKMFNYKNTVVDPVSSDLEKIKNRLENIIKKNILWIFGHHHSYKYLQEGLIKYCCLSKEFVVFDKKP